MLGRLQVNKWFIVIGVLLAGSSWGFGQGAEYPKDDGELNIVVAADTVSTLDKKVVHSGPSHCPPGKWPGQHLLYLDLGLHSES